MKHYKPAGAQIDDQLDGPSPRVNLTLAPMSRPSFFSLLPALSISGLVCALPVAIVSAATRSWMPLIIFAAVTQVHVVLLGPPALLFLVWRNAVNARACTIMGAIVGAGPSAFISAHSVGSGAGSVSLGALSGAAVGFVFWVLSSRLIEDDEERKVQEKNAKRVPTSASLRQISREVRQNYQKVNPELLAVATGNNPDFEVRVERSLREIKRASMLKLIGKILLYFSCVLLAVCFVIVAVRGWRNTPLSMPFAAIFMSMLGVFIDNHVFKVHERASAINDTLTTVKKVSGIQKNAEATEGKIPLTVGFINLSGKQLDQMLLEDATAMSRIFLRTALARSEVPKSEILFIYAELDADGSFENNSSENVRQLAQKSTASIVILASPNPADRIKKAISIAGPKTANLVFTVDRKGTAFGRFFQSLFQNMHSGKDMLSSWVALAPQGPQGATNSAPVTLLIAEAGKLAFPT